MVGICVRSKSARMQNFSRSGGDTLLLVMSRFLQFPSPVVLSTVERRITQMRTKERKRAQKSANANPQKGSKERKRALPRRSYKQP